MLVKLENIAGKPYRMLSDGERKRMLLARAHALNPGLLLVDKPTAQLDAASAREVCDVLAGLGQQGTLIFVATHRHHIGEVCSKIVDLLTVLPARAGSQS